VDFKGSRNSVTQNVNLDFCLNMTEKFSSNSNAYDLYSEVGSWYSSVGRVIRLRNVQPGVNSRQKKDIFLLSKAQSGSQTHTSSTYSVGTKAVSSGVR
jgi:hypothetical protein